MAILFDCFDLEIELLIHINAALRVRFRSSIGGTRRQVTKEGGGVRFVAHYWMQCRYGRRRRRRKPGWSRASTTRQQDNVVRVRTTIRHNEDLEIRVRCESM